MGSREQLVGLDLVMIFRSAAAVTSMKLDSVKPLVGGGQMGRIRSRAGRPIKAVDRRPARRTPIDPIRRGDWSRRPLCRTPLSDWSVRCFPGANPKSLLGRGRGLVSSPTRNELRLYFVDVRADRWRVFTVRRFVIYGPSAHTVMSIEWHETTSTPSHSISTHAARGNTPARPDKMKHKKKTGKADPLSRNSLPIHFKCRWQNKKRLERKPWAGTRRC